MKSKQDQRPQTKDHRLKSFYFMSLLSLVFCLLSLSGCIRLTGSAGYTKVKDDEVVTKSTGFDLDSSRLVDQRGVS